MSRPRKPGGGDEGSYGPANTGGTQHRHGAIGESDSYIMLPGRRNQGQIESKLSEGAQARSANRPRRAHRESDATTGRWVIPRFGIHRPERRDRPDVPARPSRQNRDRPGRRRDPRPAQPPRQSHDPADKLQAIENKYIIGPINFFSRPLHLLVLSVLLIKLSD